MQEEGLRFALSLRNNKRDAQGRCDFEKVQGIEGIYITNEQIKLLSSVRLKQYVITNIAGTRFCLVLEAELVADNEEYRFSPIVTWVHHYYPDPTQDDGLPARATERNAVLDFLAKCSSATDV